MAKQMHIKDLEKLIEGIKEAEKFQHSFDNYAGEISPGMKDCLRLAARERKENLKDMLQGYMKVDIIV